MYHMFDVRYISYCLIQNMEAGFHRKGHPHLRCQALKTCDGSALEAGSFFRKLTVKKLTVHIKNRSLRNSLKNKNHHQSRRETNGKCAR